MPEVEVSVIIEVKKNILFDLTPIIPVVGATVHIGKWWTLALRVGGVLWLLSRSPDGWHTRFEVDA